MDGNFRPAEYRSRMFRLSLISSAVSKVFAVGLQGLAIPLVYHAFGAHRYELYVLLTAALATIAMTQLGIGPGLTQGIAKASAEENIAREVCLFGAAVRLVGSCAITAGVILIVLIHMLPVQMFFGFSFVHDRQEILSAADVCVFVLVAQVLAGVVESTLAGYQEQVYTNVGSALGNIVSTVLLVLVCRISPTLINVIVIIYGVPMFSRLVNLVFLLRRRPYLLRGLTQASREAYFMLLSTGLGFWLSQMGSVLEQHSGNFILAHFASTQATDVFATVFRSVNLASAFLGLVTAPMWPAFSDAISRKEYDWVWRVYAKIARALMGYSLFMCVGIIALGAWAFQNILKIDVRGYHVIFWVMGIYVVANAWSHIHYATMAGLHAIWKSAWIQLLENLLMIAIGLILVPRLGATGMVLSYLLASLLLPSWLVPYLMKMTMRKAIEGGSNLASKEYSY